MQTAIVFHIGVATSAEEETAPASLDRVCALGFNAVLFTPPETDFHPDAAWLKTLAAGCAERGLALLCDFDPSVLDLSHPLVSAAPDAFAIRRNGEGRIADPRGPRSAHGKALLRRDADMDAVTGWWRRYLARLRAAGVGGFRARHPGGCGAALWQSLIRSDVEGLWLADAAGECREAMQALAGCGFAYTLSSLPWWDFREPWFAEEHRALSAIAPVIAPVEASERLPPASTRARHARLAVAAQCGQGLMMPAGFETPVDAQEEPMALADLIRAANAMITRRGRSQIHLSQRTGAGASVTVLLAVEGAHERTAECGVAALINPEQGLAAEVLPDTLGRLEDFASLSPLAPFCAGDAMLRPGEVRLYEARRLAAISDARTHDVHEAIAAPRVVIEAVTPSTEQGFAIKRNVGAQVTVEADIYTDGHPVLAAELLFRAADQDDWQRLRMQPLDNDRWRARFPLTRTGLYQYRIEAWIDEFASFTSDLIKKRSAGQALSVELKEGADLIQRARRDARGRAAEVLEAIATAIRDLPPAAQISLLIAPETAEAMHRVSARTHHTRSAISSIDAERREAGFAAWYEMFPRSATASRERHGTFRDVISELPRIRAMGFDVLYFPPIHPIGRTNRKGANNAVTACAGEPGSPYAIGDESGGHDAIHPELGTFEDFHALLDACKALGLEIALDFAIQCSPDHPWLKAHRNWFDWRPDGSIKYAENPPKKYQDIVNVDFYKPDAMPDLWLALRGIVEFWVGHGIRTFRVDNPHTKPFPFWKWLIADIRSRHPDVIFLAEAFTRPKVMQHLARLGFSQSYTYFTWRNTKAELTEYLSELSQPPVSNWLRPHFFVNTPDINPRFLQTAGRAGFLIRAALAATLSGLWGIYSGFELCEADALADREEYRDSEKYEIRPRDYSASGNIAAEITLLNRLRNAEPALQTHTGLRFYNAFNDQVLYFGKHAPGELSRVLVAISLDPHQPQTCEFEAPLWEWSLNDQGALESRDLCSGGVSIWRGKIQRVTLSPSRPYAIWRVRPNRAV